MLPDPVPTDPAPPSEVEMMLQTRQAERRRIAQLLHDSVSQSLMGTYLQAAMIARRLQKEDAAGVEGMNRLAEMLQQTVAELRAITQQLAEGETLPSKTENR